MDWNNSIAGTLPWDAPISNAGSKEAIARRLAQRVRDGDVIGAGSGSSSLLTLKEIGRRVREEGLSCAVIPTSREMELAAGIFGVPVTTLMRHRPDWCYDGADEVDAGGNMIKGRGGAMYREKLVMASSSRVFILADPSKFVQSLGEKFAVPVEVEAEAVHLAESGLARIGALSCALRLAKGKDGPVLTESGHFILDCRFGGIGPETEREIKSLTGVIESGLFWGYDPEIISE